jgi:hypothetical protein
MSVVVTNDVNVIAGTITMPLRGVWWADLIIDQVDGKGFNAGTEVTVKCNDGIELKGTVVPDRTGSYLDAVHVRLLGGKAGMSKTVKPKGFVQPGAYVRDVLSNINDASGESLDSSVSTSFLQSNLTAWATIEQSAAQALTALLDIVAPADNWRMFGNGKLWIGAETWPTVTPQVDVLSRNPSDGSVELGVNSPSIEPGCTIDGIGKINRVEHTIESGKIRSRVWLQFDGEERGVVASIKKMVRQEIAGIDYFTLYDAKIQSQSSDGKTVDVQPGDARLPGMSKVPLRNGVAATVCKVVPGTFVRIGWDRGDPSMPYACLWQGGETASEIAIGGSGAQFVALANKVLTELQKIQTAHNSHVHILSIVGTTGTAAAPAVTYSPSPVAAEIVKAK